MKALLKTFFHNRKIFWIEVASLLMNIAAWSVLFYSLHRTDEAYVIHYSIYFGIDRIGPWHELFTFPVTGFLVLLINTFLAAFRWKREKLFGYILILSSLFIQLLILIETLFIILRNT